MNRCREAARGFGRAWSLYCGANLSSERGGVLPTDLGFAPRLSERYPARQPVGRGKIEGAPGAD
jgi:hypothetical protein